MQNILQAPVDWLFTTPRIGATRVAAFIEGCVAFAVAAMNAWLARRIAVDTARVRHLFGQRGRPREL